MTNTHGGMRQQITVPVIRVSKEGGKMTLLGVAATSAPDKQDEVLSLEALTMLEQLLPGHDLLPSHKGRPGEELGRIDRAWQKPAGPWSLLWISATLHDDVQQATQLYNRMREGARYQLSINGSSYDYSYNFKDDGSTIRVLRDVYPDHVCVSRWGDAANPVTFAMDGETFSPDDEKMVEELVNRLASAMTSSGDADRGVPELSFAKELLDVNDGDAPQEAKRLFGVPVMYGSVVYRPALQKACDALREIHHISKEEVQEAGELVTLAKTANIDVDVQRVVHLVKETEEDTPMPDQKQETDKPEVLDVDSLLNSLNEHITAALKPVSDAVESLKGVVTEQGNSLSEVVASLQAKDNTPQPNQAPADSQPTSESTNTQQGSTGAPTGTSQGVPTGTASGEPAPAQTPPPAPPAPTPATAPAQVPASAGANDGDDEEEQDVNIEGQHYSFGEDVLATGGGESESTEPLAVSKEDFDPGQYRKRVEVSADDAMAALERGDRDKAKSILLATFFKS